MKKTEKMILDEAISKAINATKTIIIQRYIIAILIVALVAAVATIVELI